MIYDHMMILYDMIWLMWYDKISLLSWASYGLYIYNCNLTKIDMIWWYDMIIWWYIYIWWYRCLTHMQWHDMLLCFKDQLQLWFIVIVFMFVWICRYVLVWWFGMILVWYIIWWYNMSHHILIWVLSHELWVDKNRYDLF